jgi:scyllo-inositol 2-dehydrogenase (NADP+)
MNRVLNTAVVGFGISARTFHVPFLVTNPNFNWMAVVERNTNLAVSYKKDITVYRSFEAMLEDNRIDLVIITTPNLTHLPFAKAALLAGKHVVVEKPFTITTGEAKELIALSKSTGKLLSIYHNRRYVTDFKTIQQLLQQQLLGKLAEMEIHYNRYRPEAKPNAWREEPLPGSGILYDLGSHLIDQALVLFGPPATITAFVAMQRSHARADDYFDLRLDYGALQVRIKAGMLVREPGPRYQLHGDKGSFIKYGMDPQEEQLKSGLLPTDTGYGVEPKTSWGHLHTEFEGKIINEKYPSLPATHTDYYTGIYNSIVIGMPLEVTPQMAHNTIRLIELAIESNQKKCTIACDGFLE